MNNLPRAGNLLTLEAEFIHPVLVRSSAYLVVQCSSTSMATQPPSPAQVLPLSTVHCPAFLINRIQKFEWALGSLSTESQPSLGAGLIGAEICWGCGSLWLSCIDIKPEPKAPGAMQKG